MPDRWFRLRGLVDAHFAAACTALVVLALAGGWLTYGTYADPGTTTERQVASWWEPRGQFAHAATVTGDNDVYPVGTTLENRSVYATEVSPQLDGTYAFAYDAGGDGSLDVTVRLALVTRAVEPREDGKAVVWERTERLEESSAGSVAPGDPVRVPFSVDARAVTNRTDRVHEQFGRVGRTEARVVATVQVEGRVDGQAVDRRFSQALPLSLDGAVYRVGPAEELTARQESTETVTVARTYGPLRRFGAPALAAGSLLALAGLAWARHRGALALSERERERLAYEDARSDYDEWITRARLPGDAARRPRVEVDSLEGLVDLAIDTDGRVVRDDRLGVYCVLHDGFRYEYAPPWSGNGHRPSGRAQTSLGEWQDDGDPGRVVADSDSGSGAADR